MEIRFNVRELKDILEEYYKERDKIDYRVTFHITKVGDYYDGEKCVITANKIQRVSVFGKEKAGSIELSEEKIIADLIDAFNKNNFEVNQITLDSGIKEEWIGYGRCEERMVKPYFNGAITQLKDHVKIKTMIGG